MTIDATNGLLANDTDAEGDTLAVQNPGSIILTSGSSTLTVNADGSFSFTPSVPGPATLTYTVTGGTGGTDTATVTISVTEPISPAPSNNPPLAGNDTATTGQGTRVRTPSWPTTATPMATP